MIGWLAVALLFGLIFVAVPIGFGLMITAAVSMYFAGMPMMTYPIQMFFGTNSYPLLAIPMFILMGELMGATSISRRLIELAAALVGWIRGALGHINVVTSMFMAEMSGSGVADAAVMSKIFVPEMERKGYPRAYAGAITAVSATIGIIIPPSIPLVLYGVITYTSIRDLFIAGIVPGILLGLAFMVTNYIFARKLGFPKDAHFEVKRLGVAFKDALIPLLIPVVVVGGLIGGVFTPTEASAIGVMVALIFGTIITRDLNLQRLGRILYNTARQASVVMMLVAGSAVLGQYLANEQLPQQIVAIITELSENPYVILFILNIFLLLLGMFLHASAAIIIVVPMLLPLAQTAGVDPVHFGIIVALNLGIGQQTPPVASIMLTVCSVTGIRIHEILHYGKWFLVTMFVVLMLVTYIPALSMWFRVF